MSTEEVLVRLRQLDPEGVYDFNHIYTESSSEIDVDQVDDNDEAEENYNNDLSPNSATVSATTSTTVSAPATSKESVKIGLIDGGVDVKHAVFQDVDFHEMPCPKGAKPSLHGTSIAALMAGQSEVFHGVLSKAHIYSADLYCHGEGFVSTENLSAAIAWMAAQKVAVINISLVGPPNRSLENSVRMMVDRGYLLVAAVGNDGPTAAPLYPANYPGVIGVTGVDQRGRVLPEAVRGPQVMFAAPGSQMVSANINHPPYRQVRGTSFATPIVAAMLAMKLSNPTLEEAKLAVKELIKEAQSSNNNTINTEIGYGIVGMRYRVSPRDFQ